MESHGEWIAFERAALARNFQRLESFIFNGESKENTDDMRDYLTAVGARLDAMERKE